MKIKRIFDRGQILPALICIGIIIRIIGAFINPITSDAAAHAINAQEFFNHPLVLYDAILGKKVNVPYVDSNGIYWYPPLFHILLAPFSITSFTLRLFSPLFFSFSVILFYKFANYFFKRKVAEYSTVFYIYQPFSVLITSVVFAEGLLFFLVTFCLYWLTRYDESKKYVYLMGVGLCLALGVMVKYSALPLFFALAAYFSYKKDYKALAVFSLFFGVFLSPYIARNYAITGNFFYVKVSGEQFLNYVAVGYGSYVHPDNTPQKEFIKTYFEFFGVPQGEYTNLILFSPYVFVGFVLLSLVVAMTIIVSLVKGLSKKNMLIIFLLLVFFLLKAALFIAGSGQHFRYMSLSIIPISVFLGLYVYTKTKNIRILVLAVYMILGSAVLLKFFIANQEYSDFEKVLPFFESHEKSRIGVFDYWFMLLNYPQFENIEFAQTEHPEKGQKYLVLRRSPEYPYKVVLQTKYWVVYSLANT